MKTPLSPSTFSVLAVTTAATIATHLAHLPPWLTPALAVLIVLRVAWRRRHPGAVPGALRLPLAALLMAAIIGEYGNVLGRDPGSAFGCGLLALKLLEAETPRDARVTLGFCAFVLMSALLFEQGLPFTLMVCGVLLLQVAAFNRLEPAPLPSPRPLRQSLMLAGRLLLLALPLAFASFVLIPRLGTPLWGAPGGGGGARTGLSESMAPGQFTDLMLDDSPAFRVTFDGPPPAPDAQYFRTLVLGDFDGTTWTRTPTGRRSTTPPRLQAGQIFDYRITIEPTEQRWLPALDTPIQAPDGAVLAGDETLIATRPLLQAREYRVRSRVGAHSDTTLPAWQRERFLALPDAIDPRARALAAQWRRQASSDADVVERALALFHANFTYTLTPPLLGRDSVDEFLFDTRSGFCEHYASAFVFLMRAAGIPARVVTGYQGGWWSNAGGYLLVRQSDAHAWAEIWRNGSGWQRVDPTAAVSPARIEHGAARVNDAPSWNQTDWLRSLRNHIDIINRWWTQGVIRFDALRQRALLTEFGLVHNQAGDLLLALSGTLALMLLLATLWALRDLRDRRGDALDRGWRDLQRRLIASGLPANPADGPHSMWQHLHAQDAALAGTLRPLVDEYARLRYASATPPDAQMQRWLNARRQWLSTHLRRRGIQQRLRRMQAWFATSRSFRGSS